jgi:hypothetical protein
MISLNRLTRQIDLRDGVAAVAELICQGAHR